MSSNPGIDFSTVNCYPFLGKFTCDSSGENTAIRNVASGHDHKPVDRLTYVCLHLCPEFLIHFRETLSEFQTQEKGLRLFGDLLTLLPVEIIKSGFFFF